VAEAEKAGVLPVQDTVLAHHGKTIFGPMREWLQAGRVPPVLLLTGIKGVGKREVAYFLAQWILCERNPLSTLAKPAAENEAAEEESLFGGELFGAPPAAPISNTHESELKPCGTCAACQRALRGSWVDFTEILPDEDTGTLKIEPLRKLKASVGFGSHEGGYRITLIPGADRMTPQAANSVLKLLEEPPPGWLFFLTAGDPTLVLPTILSRCQTLRLKPLDSGSIEKILQNGGVSRDRAAICSELAHGSLVKAQAFADEEIWSQRKTFFAFLTEPQAHLNSLQDWAAADSSQFDLFLDQLESIALDLTRLTLGSNSSNPERHDWVNRDGTQALAKHASNAIRALGGVDQARNFWIARAQRLARARSEALTPVNRKLLIQDLLLPWLNAVRK